MIYGASSSEFDNDFVVGYYGEAMIRIGHNTSSEWKARLAATAGVYLCPESNQAAARGFRPEDQAPGP